MHTTRPGDDGMAAGAEAALDRRARWTALAAGGGYAVAVAYALLATLRSPTAPDVDGLGGAAQLPLSLPWAFMVPRGSGHVADAWLDAGLGLANAALLYAALRWAVPPTRHPHRAA